jgi:UMP-CMP kinase
MPVVDYYRAQDRVVDIDSSPPVDVVYANVRLAVEARLNAAAGATTAAATAVAPEPVAAQAAAAAPASALA